MKIKEWSNYRHQDEYLSMAMLQNMKKTLDTLMLACDKITHDVCHLEEHKDESSKS